MKPREGRNALLTLAACECERMYLCSTRGRHAMRTVQSVLYLHSKKVNESSFRMLRFKLILGKTPS